MRDERQQTIDRLRRMEPSTTRHGIAGANTGICRHCCVRGTATVLVDRWSNEACWTCPHCGAQQDPPEDAQHE